MILKGYGIDLIELGDIFVNKNKENLWYKYIVIYIEQDHEKTEDIYGMLEIQLLDTGQHMGTKEIVKYYMHEIEGREFLYLGNIQSNSTKM